MRRYVLRSNPRQADQFTDNEFDACAIAKYARLEEMVVLKDRKRVTLKFDCHIIHANVPRRNEPIVAMRFPISCHGTDPPS